MARFVSPASALATVSLLAIGCAQPAAPAIQPVRSETAGALNAAYSSFDGIKEPKLTARTHLAAARLAESRGDVRQSILQYQEVLRIDPTADEALYRLGVILTEQKRYDEARSIWHRYILATNGAATAYANLGFCLQVQERFAEAEQVYRQGLARDPTNEDCRVNIGLLYARQGKYGPAAREWQGVLKQTEVWYNLGSAAEGRADVVFAREAYLYALGLDADFLPAQTRLQALAKAEK